MKTKLSTSAFESKYKLDIRQACTYEPEMLFRQRDENYRYVIDYDITLSNGQPLQRDFVWTIEQKRALIISMLKRFVLPNFLVVIYRPDDKSRQIFKIIDGKQRLSTIEQFINGEFGLMLDDEEYFFGDLDVEAKRRINSYSLNFNIIYEYDDCKLSDAQLVSAFEYVNFAGTPQDIEHFDKLKTYIKSE
jgi:uncharacterized protein with ParB-like and HNH nuclease domain